MKQKDIALIVIVSGIAAILAFVLGNVVLGGTDLVTKVEKVDSINSEFVLPNSKYFNSESLNPTKLINIGEDPNLDPFVSE